MPLIYPVALAAVHSLLLLPLFVGVCVWPLFLFIMQYVLISFAIISLKMKEFVAICYVSP